MKPADTTVITLAATDSGSISLLDDHREIVMLSVTGCMKRKETGFVKETRLCYYGKALVSQKNILERCYPQSCDDFSVSVKIIESTKWNRTQSSESSLNR